MISILMELKNRIEKELQIFDDIQNVRDVMVGDISMSDHTALFCVHEHMVRRSKMVKAKKIRRYIAKISNFIKEIEALFSLHYFNLQQEEEKERLRTRRRRRGAPERLNITTTKKNHIFSNCLTVASSILIYLRSRRPI